VSVNEKQPSTVIPEELSMFHVGAAGRLLNFSSPASRAGKQCGGGGWMTASRFPFSIDARKRQQPDRKETAPTEVVAAADAIRRCRGRPILRGNASDQRTTVPRHTGTREPSASATRPTRSRSDSPIPRRCWMTDIMAKLFACPECNRSLPNPGPIKCHFCGANLSFVKTKADYEGFELVRGSKKTLRLSN
jgi:hypothetical protein